MLAELGTFSPPYRKLHCWRGSKTSPIFAKNKERGYLKELKTVLLKAAKAKSFSIVLGRFYKKACSGILTDHYQNHEKPFCFRKTETALV